jgi:multidrug transporter EmrE-like cation transporter
MNRATLSYLLSGVMLNVVAQLCLKAATNRLGTVSLAWSGLGDTILRAAGQPFLWLGLGCYGVSVGVWVAALSRTEVSLAYPFLSLGYVVNAAAAWYLFGENLSPQRLLAVAVIILGVLLLARTA